MVNIFSIYKDALPFWGLERFSWAARRKRYATKTKLSFRLSSRELASVSVSQLVFTRSFVTQNGLVNCLANLITLALLSWSWVHSSRGFTTAFTAISGLALSTFASRLCLVYLRSLFHFGLVLASLDTDSFEQVISFLVSWFLIFFLSLLIPCTGVFLSFGLSGVIPAVHYSVQEGWIKALNQASLGWLILMGLLYIIGTMFYALRIPERFFPGKFDIWVRILNLYLTAACTFDSRTNYNFG